MKTATLLSLIVVSVSLITMADANSSKSWPLSIPSRIQQVWHDGKVELYVSGYAWHNRYTYRKAKIKTYNEKAWGGGLGKGRYDENGNWHGLYTLAFLDSHSNVEPVVGYAFLNVAHLDANNRLGLGYTLLVTSRPDIFHGKPFPGALPWVSFNHRKLTISATYIPSGAGAGNVLYIWGKWTFDL